MVFYIEGEMGRLLHADVQQMGYKRINLKKVLTMSPGCNIVLVSIDTKREGGGWPGGA